MALTQITYLMKNIEMNTLTKKLMKISSKCAIFVLPRIVLD